MRHLRHAHARIESLESHRIARQRLLIIGRVVGLFVGLGRHVDDQLVVLAHEHELLLEELDKLIERGGARVLTDHGAYALAIRLAERPALLLVVSLPLPQHVVEGVALVLCRHVGRRRRGRRRCRCRCCRCVLSSANTAAAAATAHRCVRVRIERHQLELEEDQLGLLFDLLDLIPFENCQQTIRFSFYFYFCLCLMLETFTCLLISCLRMRDEGGKRCANALM